MNRSPTLVQPVAPLAQGTMPGAPMRLIALFAIPTLIWGSTWRAIIFQLGVVAPEASVVVA